jgi:hypothetical protein
MAQHGEAAPHPGSKTTRLAGAETTDGKGSAEPFCRAGEWPQEGNDHADRPTAAVGRSSEGVFMARLRRSAAPAQSLRVCEKRYRL